MFGETQLKRQNLTVNERPFEKGVFSLAVPGRQ